VTGPAPAPALVARGLRKSFGAVRAVRGMDIALHPGEVQGLIGENGAGKSTFLGMLAGRVRPDGGEVVIDGVSHAALTPHLARALGISIVYQELSLCPNMSVAENIFIGDPPTRGGVLLRRDEMRRAATELLSSLGASVDPDAEVSDLRPADQQLTEIARSLAHQARVLILDEPTSSLTHEDFEVVRSMLESLRNQGVAILFVSHRLSEVLELCGSITVMRDGSAVATLPAESSTEAELASHMVGNAAIRPRAKRRLASEHAADVPPRLELRSASHPGLFEDVSLHVRPGEIVGLAGLRGSGRHELTEAIYGLTPLADGDMRMDGQPVRPHDAKAGRALGMTYVPQERRAQGLVSVWDVQRNLALGNIDLVLHRGLLLAGRLRRWAAIQIERFGVTPPQPSTPITSLSGGNQQKVVVARNLVTLPRLLILVEPTRGIDVAAKAEVAALVAAAADAGAGVLVVDSEVAELLALSDRIYVMHRGRMAGEVAGDRMTEERIAFLAAGGVDG
jgi:rhamnose transport system ATP-binding protein